jgi:hypothetical protein
VCAVIIEDQVVRWDLVICEPDGRFVEGEPDGVFVLRIQMEFGDDARWSHKRRTQLSVAYTPTRTRPPGSWPTRGVKP